MIYFTFIHFFRNFRPVKNSSMKTPIFERLNIFTHDLNSLSFSFDHTLVEWAHYKNGLGKRVHFNNDVVALE